MGRRVVLKWGLAEGVRFRLANCGESLIPEKIIEQGTEMKSFLCLGKGKELCLEGSEARERMMWWQVGMELLPNSPLHLDPHYFS